MGTRSGQGYGVEKPKRARCPETDCGKKGVTGWKATAAGLCRHCQFCGMAWGEAGWALALKIKKEKA